MSFHLFLFLFLFFFYHMLAEVDLVFEFFVYGRLGKKKEGLNGYFRRE